MSEELLPSPPVLLTREDDFIPNEKLYEVKHPFIIPKPRPGMDIDQEYVFHSLPLNKEQRKYLFEVLTGKAEPPHEVLIEESPMVGIF